VKVDGDEGQRGTNYFERELKRIQEEEGKARHAFDVAGFQPKQVTCNACGGSGRLSSTGGKCDICGGRGNFVSGGKAPLKLSEPGTPSGWGKNYRIANDSTRRARLHRALDKVLDAGVSRDDGSMEDWHQAIQAKTAMESEYKLKPTKANAEKLAFWKKRADELWKKAKLSK